MKVTRKIKMKKLNSNDYDNMNDEMDKKEDKFATKNKNLHVV